MPPNVGKDCVWIMKHHFKAGEKVQMGSLFGSPVISSIGLSKNLSDLDSDSLKANVEKWKPCRAFHSLLSTIHRSDINKTWQPWTGIRLPFYCSSALPTAAGCRRAAGEISRKKDQWGGQRRESNASTWECQVDFIYSQHRILFKSHNTFKK